MNKSLLWSLVVTIWALAITIADVDAAIPQQNLERKNNNKDKGTKMLIYFHFIIFHQRFIQEIIKLTTFTLKKKKTTKC